MKAIIGSALVAMALIGTAVSASAGPVPGHDASLQKSLAFWQQFADRND